MVEQARPNILLVVLDSVRARNCGLYGHANETTPFLSSFAEEAVVYEQARAPSIHSVASHASIFSGYEVEEHEVTEHESRLDPTATIWAELADEHGYDTGLFTPNVIVTESSNLAEPFETVEGPRRETNKKVFGDATSPAEIPGELSPTEYFRAAIGDDHPIKALLNGVYDQLTTIRSHDPRKEHASVYVDEFLQWSDERSGHWAACLNLMDAHAPYVPDDEHDKWAGEPIRAIHEELRGSPLAKAFLKGRSWGQLRALESLYDGCIHQLDAELERLVSSLAERGVLEDTLLVVTADHGEAFGELSDVTPAARVVSHSWGINEVQTHVPLIVSQPSGGGGSVESPATLTEFPKVIEALLEGEDIAHAFVPADGVVVSSTYRIRPPGEELPIPEGEREPYLGPWRAVYRESEEGVTKYVEHRGDTAAVRIRDVQVHYAIEDDSSDVVTDTFAEFEDPNVAIDDGEDRIVDRETEERLEDLGYLR